jgi:hypothetical protein
MWAEPSQSSPFLGRGEALSVPTGCVDAQPRPRSAEDREGTIEERRLGDQDSLPASRITCSAWSAVKVGYTEKRGCYCSLGRRSAAAVAAGM